MVSFGPQDRELLAMDKVLLDDARPAPITLAWQDLNVYATVTGGESGSKKSFRHCLKSIVGAAGEKSQFKRILDNVSGCVSSGTLIGVMGSSGAGKSTLMTTLAFRRPPGSIVQGDIIVNGTPVGPFMHQLSGFVYQDDIFVGTLTAREHLTFMVQLKQRQRLAKAEINAKIYQVMARAGLHRSCLDRKIGQDSDLKKVLSGGEKKRLSFATELISDPLVLFCDEPTTGLDSYTARHVMTTMKALAEAGTIIICTIHQPSQEIFEQLHQVMLLADGRLAFNGTPQEAVAFFADNGHTVGDSATGSTAGFLISILSSHGRARQLADQFAVTKLATERDRLIGLERRSARDQKADQYADLAIDFRATKRWSFTGFWLPVYLLTGRTLLNVRRDPTVQIIRFVQKIIIAIMCGLCFFGSLNYDQLGVQAVQGAIFITVSENTFHAMYSVVAVFPNDFPIFIRERKSGLYNIVQYYLSNILGMLPGLIVEPLAFVFIFYFLVGFQATWSGFLLTCLVTILVINVATACGYFFSVTFNSVAFGMAYLVPFDYILMTTSGVFVQLASLSGPFRYLKFLSWFMYATESMSIIQWEGVHNITCPTNVQLPCLSTGQEVLDHYSFDAAHLYSDLIALVGLYLGFHTLGMLFLYRRTK